MKYLNFRLSEYIIMNEYAFKERGIEFRDVIKSAAKYASNNKISYIEIRQEKPSLSLIEYKDNEKEKNSVYKIELEEKELDQIVKDIKEEFNIDRVHQRMIIELLIGIYIKYIYANVEKENNHIKISKYNLIKEITEINEDELKLFSFVNFNRKEIIACINKINDQLMEEILILVNYWDVQSKKKEFDKEIAGIKGDVLFSAWYLIENYLSIKNISMSKKMFISKVKNDSPYIKMILSRIQTLDDIILNKIMVNFLKLYKTKGNVITLPERSLQKRGLKPYRDYVPRFLEECFEGGKFSYAFKEKNIEDWVREEYLEYFFYEKNINISEIKDLLNDKSFFKSGSSKMKADTPKEMIYLLEFYIDIIKIRNYMKE